MDTPIILGTAIIVMITVILITVTMGVGITTAIMAEVLTIIIVAVPAM